MSRLISFCGETGKNTGGMDCDIQLGNAQFYLIGSAKFLPSEYATEAALKAAVIDRIRRANGDSEKLYPFVKVNSVNKTTEADTVETAGDGTKRTLRTAPESYELDAWKVGLNQEAALIAFNNVTIPVFMFDDTQKMIGKFDSDLNFVGNNATLYTKGQGLGTYAAGPVTKTTVSFVDPLALSVNAKVFEFTSLDIDDFEGLLDAELRTLVAPTGNTHKIGVFVANKSIGKDKNLYTEYSTELADVDLWIGESAAGAEVIPDTVVIDAVNLGWTIAFPSAVVLIKLAAPPDLSDADVVGIEGIDLAV